MGRGGGNQQWRASCVLCVAVTSPAPHSHPAPACLLASLLLLPLLSNHQGQWVAEAVNCCDACDALVSPLHKVTDGNPIIFISSSSGGRQAGRQGRRTGGEARERRGFSEQFCCFVTSTRNVLVARGSTNLNPSESKRRFYFRIPRGRLKYSALVTLPSGSAAPLRPQRCGRKES